jgi:hypothetical protein
MFFEEYIKFKSLLKVLWSYNCLKFRESYTPPAIQIRVSFFVEVFFLA